MQHNHSWAAEMYLVASTLLLAVVPIAAHSESSCIIPSTAPAFTAESAAVAGHFIATRHHPATSTGPESETQFQLWLLGSGEAQVQRDSWATGEFQKRRTGILRGRWSIERGYVIVRYGDYCETLVLLEASGASPGQQRLKGVHLRPSSAWLFGNILERTRPDTELPVQDTTSPAKKAMP
jgi:hypothetical protein